MKPTFNSDYYVKLFFAVNVPPLIQRIKIFILFGKTVFGICRRRILKTGCR